MKLEGSEMESDNPWEAGLIGERAEGERAQESEQIDVEQLGEGEDESDMIVVSEDDTQGTVFQDAPPALHSKSLNHVCASFFLRGVELT